MTALTVALVTVGILLLSNAIGLVYSLIVLREKLPANIVIQQKPYKKGVFRERMPLFLFNFVILLTVSGVGAYFLFDLLTLEFDPLTVTIQVILAFVFDDIWFYFYHRWLHENEFMLKHVHSIHHRAFKPFPLEYLYAHPLEWMLGMVGTVLAFGVFVLFSSLNVYSFWIFGLLRNLHEIHIHSDLSLPILSKIPFISTTKHHDDHHARLKGNYSSTFHWLDRLFKTEIK
jgi:sterol desaturase/sphingolipid hydroxylase (fatty acid hydroxylase superfamily)